MAVNLSPIWGAGAQLLDNSGNVLTGGKIYTYLAGTTTPATTYTSSNGATANSNPIILNSAGRVPYEIWLTDSVEYKFVLKDSNDTLIGTWDNLVGINSNFINYYGQQEIQTATAGQTVFTLTEFEYQPNTGNLSVFVDGVNQYGPGAQYAYVETDSTTVTFVSGLHVGASVKFTTTKLENPGVADASQVSYTYPDANAVSESVEARLAQYVSVKDFGAVGDGVTDDTTAIQNAIDALSPNGGTLWFPTGKYVISSTLEVGDGTNTSRSTVCGIKLVGASGGVGEGEFGAPNYGTEIFWDGASSNSVSVIRFNGPIHSCGIQNIYINCNLKAGTGVELQHPYQCSFTNVNVDEYTYRGWILVSRTGAVSGVTQGAMDNTFINCFARYPASSAVETGFYMDGNDANNIGCSRNVFINCLFLVAGDTGTRGMYIGFVDNCVFDRVTTAWAGTTYDGVGVYANGSVTTPGFPGENLWNGCSLLGGYVVNGTTGNNLLVSYGLGDGEPLPVWDGKNKAVLIDGRLWGGFSGSACMLGGYTLPSTGLNTTGINYFSISGASPSGLVSNQNAAVVMPVGGKIVAFRTRLDTAPGVGSAREISLRINGSATTAVVNYSAAQSGDRLYTLTTGIPFNGGDLIEVLSQVIGSAAASSQAHFSMMFYPVEVI